MAKNLLSIIAKFNTEDTVRAKDKCNGDLAKRMSFLLHALKARIARLKKEAENLRRKSSGSDSKKQSKSENQEPGGYLGGAVGMVGGAVGTAVNWGWGAIGGEKEVTVEVVREGILSDVAGYK